MIVTRYWFTIEDLPRKEVIEWTEASFPDPGVAIAIPEVAEVEGMLDPTTPLSWLSVNQPAFDGALDQDVDFYTRPPTEGAEVLTREDWQARVDAQAVERERADAAFRKQIEERATKRQQAIEKIAQSVNLSTDLTQALIGGL